VAFFINLFYRICGDHKPDILQLGRDMTPESMDQFNRNTPNSPTVYYQSYSSSATDKNVFLYIPCTITRYCEQDMTDGMVSVSSSQWGNYQGDISDDLDHYKMVGLYGSKKDLADVGKLYLYIIQNLQDMGF